MERSSGTGTAIGVRRVGDGVVVDRDEVCRHVRHMDPSALIDRLFVADDPVAVATDWFDGGDDEPDGLVTHAPIGQQEVWAAGVTYRRSRNARKAESTSGADRFYDAVYEARRPELFFKATPHRVVGPGDGVRIRTDSTWDVPEPELALALSRDGRIIGSTIGNDMSSRSIEGENPLYLPQAKLYDACAALGPRLVLGAPPGAEAGIALEIRRGDAVVSAGTTSLAQIHRSFDELVGHLFHDNSFPSGAYLMTGTGIVPDDGFTLEPGDEVAITIDGLGTLVNHVVRG